VHFEFLNTCPAISNIQFSVKGETDAARAWHANWGSLFAPNEPRSFSDKIALLKQQMEKLPTQALMSNTQMSFTEVKPYKEYSNKSHKRRSAWNDDL